LLDALTTMQWREPAWLLLALLPLFAWLWQYGKRAKMDFSSNPTVKKRLERYAEPHLWPWLIVAPQGRPSSPWCYYTAWTMAAIALAGPSLLLSDDEHRERRGIDIAVVVDISPSMRVRDLQPDRLSRVQQELTDFVALLNGDRLALIAFSANAYPVLPLSHDYGAFLHFVTALDPALAKLHASMPGRALTLAASQLQRSRYAGKAVILLSDGDNIDDDALSAAQTLRQQQIPLFVIGIGTTSGGPIPGDDGRFIEYGGDIARSTLNRPNLGKLAQNGGGDYFELSHDNNEWQQLLTALRSSTQENSYPTHFQPQRYELFPWFIALGLLLFLIDGARRAATLPCLPIVATAMLSLLLVLPSTGNANPLREWQAYRALQQQRYTEAAALYQQLNSFEGALGHGVAAYRLQHWDEASAAFDKALRLAQNSHQRATAAYNLGNAQAQAGQLDAAVSAYESALKWQPLHPRTQGNLRLVKEALLQHRAGQRDNPQAPALRSGMADIEQADKTTPQQRPTPPNRRDNKALRSAQQQMNTLKDDTQTLLRFRFAEEDRHNVMPSKERPW